MLAILPENGKMLFSEIPRPVCADNEVLIKVVAAGVNRPDVLQRKGLYPPPPSHSPVLGLEVSGTVVEKGRFALKYELNDKVCALVNGGGYAEFCSVPESQCLPVPAELDMVSAACLPETFFTVWHNVFQQTNIFQEKIKAGDTILIHGGSSGIGTTAIQLAKRFGITVITTVGNEEKCQKCLEIGADHAINYRTSDFVSEVQRITNNVGVDLVLDIVSGDYIQKDISILKFQGRIAIIGSLGEPTGQIDFRQVMRKRLTIGGTTLRAQSTEAKEQIAKELMDQVWPLIAQKKVLPIIDTTFPFKQAPQSHELMESSTHIGKIALTFE
jgi:NADPH2:quinone reductase